MLTKMWARPDLNCNLGGPAPDPCEPPTAEELARVLPQVRARTFAEARSAMEEGDLDTVRLLLDVLERLGGGD